MKKYIEPEIALLRVADVLLTSGDFGAGESLWDNETPLIPFG